MAIDTTNSASKEPQAEKGDLVEPSSPNEGSSKKPNQKLGVIFLTVFLDLVGFSIIFPLFPKMLEWYFALEGGDGLLGDLLNILRAGSGAVGDKQNIYTAVLFGGVLGSLYASLQFIFAPIWGKLSDRNGRRRILIITVAGTCLSYILWFFSGTFFLLVCARILGGLMSGNISVASAAVADVTTRENRAKGMGMLGAAFGLGFIIGPAMGGLLAQFDLTQGALAGIPGINPFSMPALVAALLSIVNLVWIYFRFEETVTKENQEKAQGRPSNPLVLLKPVDIDGVNRANLVFFIYTLAFTGMEFTLTFLASDRFNYSPIDNAYLFIFVGFIIVLVQGGIVRRLAPKYGEIKICIAGLLLLFPGLVLVGQCQTEFVLYSGLGLLSVGSALVNPSMSALVSLYTPTERQGEVLGIFRSLGSLARATGPIIACTAYWKLGAQWPYFGAALLLVIPFLLAFSMRTANQEQP
jgi:MFS family permease